MKSRNKISRVVFVVSLIFTGYSLTACDQNRPQLAGDAGNFKSVVQQSFTQLENGEIIRNEGFNTECSVDFKSANGIRISETVCDQDNIRKVTIRVTDPSARPPSQQLEKIQLSTNSGETISADRGKTEIAPSGIKIIFDRSGQSVVMDGQVARKF